LEGKSSVLWRENRVYFGEKNQVYFGEKNRPPQLPKTVDNIRLIQIIDQLRKLLITAKIKIEIMSKKIGELWIH
jgi:hypothetical protein